MAWGTDLLTGALVVTTAVYASFTYVMMRTADRTEKFNRRPTLGLDVVSASPFSMEPTLPQPALMLSVRLSNLGIAPLLHIQVKASLTSRDFEDSKSIFPLPIVPFLTPGETTHVAFSFVTPFDGLFAVAQQGRGDVNISSDDEEGPFVDFGQNYPEVYLEATFTNQAEDCGSCTSRVSLYPVGNLDEEHEFMISPTRPEETLNCVWKKPPRTYLWRRRRRDRA